MVTDALAHVMFLFEMEHRRLRLLTESKQKPDTARIAESKGIAECTVHTSGPTAQTKKMTTALRGRVSLKGCKDRRSLEFGDT